MNPRTLKALEFDKILARLAEHTNFSASAERVRGLLPSDDLRQAEQWQAETAEAVALLEERKEASMGGVRDVRPLLPQAERGSVLLPHDLLEIRSTLLRARSLRQTFTRLQGQFPHIADMAARIEPCDHVAAEIGRCINERGEVVDSASDKLARLRRELRTAQDRLLTTLERMVTSSANAPYLQEPIVTQRQGRYVIPLKTEFKGRIPGLVHDHSSSGATLFIEPLATVELNNQWREKQIEEEKEVRRILTELTDLVAEEATYIRRTVEALAELDFTFAKARYAQAIDATCPELAPFRPPRQTSRQGLHGKGRKERDGHQDREQPQAFQHPGSALDLKQARHPLLDPETVVPIDVWLDDEYFILVITGPNTGGKTVTLKTVGLLALMAQAGMHIPAEDGSRLSVFEGIYADIGDEQSIEQSLSTFSSHMTNIVDILDEADPHCLVLLDELGAGTDPEEGSALARALLDNLLSRGITALATTHYSELKVYAHATSGVRNASVEFDLETLAPTFELRIGLPGRSNAFAIAGRLGLNPSIVAAAEAMVRPESLEAEGLLAEIKETRAAMEAARKEAEAAERRARTVEKELRYKLAQIEEARREVIAEAREMVQAQLEELHSELNRIRSRMHDLPAAGRSHDAFLAEAEALLSQHAGQEEDLDTEVESRAGEAVDQGPLEEGDIVWVPSLQTSGEITELDEREEEAEVRMGSFRLRLPLHRLELREKRRQHAPVAETSARRGATVSSPGIEVDLRGWRVEDMLPRLEKYIEDAYLAGLPWVRIIHGKGTGALREAVRKAIHGHPLVSTHRPGQPNEGGDGVTVVRFVGHAQEEKIEA